MHVPRVFYRGFAHSTAALAEDAVYYTVSAEIETVMKSAREMGLNTVEGWAFAGEEGHAL